jgi:hypothetical protein
MHPAGSRDPSAGPGKDSALLIALRSHAAADRDASPWIRRRHRPRDSSGMTADYVDTYSTRAKSSPMRTPLTRTVLLLIRS